MRARPRLEQRGRLGIWCRLGPGALTLSADIPLVLATDRTAARGILRVRACERRYVSLSYSEEGPAVVPALGEAAGAKVERTRRWWREWAARCTYTGPYRAAVVRSALALKLLTFAPSGAIIAAPTTSLPERVGGNRNWDYRYCWLRDASFTMRALLSLGYREEAEAFLNWMLHATRLTWPELQVVYDVYGRARLRERELTHLEGYAGSRPVRTGNAADRQLQLDVYGEVVDAASQLVQSGGTLDRDTGNLLRGLGETVCKRWREQDNGLWEVRGERLHYTHSKLMCWVALDRLVKLHDEGHVNVPAGRFRRGRDAIRAAIDALGYNARLGGFVRTFDGDEVDAAPLVAALHGYFGGSDPRATGTLACVRQRLGRDSLIFRYDPRIDDGLPPGEGAFGIAGFWAVECLARAGRLDEATRAFEELLGYAGPVGLFAEEIDPETGEALGNYPQGFTHIGLINAALTLAECGARQASGHTAARKAQT